VGTARACSSPQFGMHTHCCILLPLLSTGSDLICFMFSQSSSSPLAPTRRPVTPTWLPPPPTPSPSTSKFSARKVSSSTWDYQNTTKNQNNLGWLGVFVWVRLHTGIIVHINILQDMRVSSILNYMHLSASVYLIRCLHNDQIVVMYIPFMHFSRRFFKISSLLVCCV